MGEAVHVWGQWVCGESLHLLNFAVNSKRAPTMKPTKNEHRKSKLESLIV